MEESGSFVYLIKHLEMGLRPRFIEACAEGGLTYGQYTALTVLKHRPGSTSSELARRSFVRAQSMAATVDPLLEAGLVRREQDPEHARKRLLYLTPEGDRMIDQLSPAVDDLQDLLLGDLDEDERRQFASFLRRCRHALDEADAS